VHGHRPGAGVGGITRITGEPDGERVARLLTRDRIAWLHREDFYSDDLGGQADKRVAAGKTTARDYRTDSLAVE